MGADNDKRYIGRYVTSNNPALLNFVLIKKLSRNILDRSNELVNIVRNLIDLIHTIKVHPSM